MPDFPPPPPGFAIEATPAPRRRRAKAADNAPAPPPGFERVNAPSSPAASSTPMAATGEAHDGDTFRLDNGQSARMLGYDAFELNQTGRSPTGQVVPLGVDARTALLPLLKPNSTVTASGSASYGRPVVSLANGQQDAGEDLLRQGHGLATPEYLKADGARFHNYMEAERFARQNRQGAFGNTFQSPSSFRHGASDPWNAPQAGTEGNSEAVFWDEPTPFQGLRPEIAHGWEALQADPKATADDLVAFAKSNAFEVNPAEVRTYIDRRNRGGNTTVGTVYADKPRVLTDPGDGVVGAALRGVADPINMLDEMGGVVDSLVPTNRENVWSSDRRFGDILANNTDQNRSILGHDDAEHPWARFGGQVAGSVIVPGASVEGVGFAAARKILQSGGTRFAAEAAAKAAIRNRLTAAGALEGAAAGFGSGETWTERGTNAFIGGGIGGTLGAASGTGGQAVIEALSGRAAKRLAKAAARAEGRGADDAAPTSAGAAENGVPESVAAPPANGPVVSNIPQEMEGNHLLGPASLLGTGSVPAKGKPGVSVINDEGHVATAIYRDDEGAARGVVRIPVSAEARDVYENTSAFVDPAFRRQGIASKLYDALRDEGHPIDELSGSGDLTPAGAAFVNARRGVAAMDAEHGAATLTGPLADIPPPPPGYRVVDRVDVNARPRPMLDDVTEALRRGQASRIKPRDVLPLPDSAVSSAEEAAAIGRGLYPEVKAPNEGAELSRRSLPSPVDGTKTIAKRGPLDLVTWLRTQGGVRPQSGELAHYGIDNAPRQGMDFAGGENRFGKLVDPNGMSYDEAAMRAHEAGYFPDHAERPTPSEFLDALVDTHSGRNRSYHPDDYAEIDGFNAARSSRQAVEAAREAGAPLVEDRGHPIDLADLEKNSAPIHAYEDWGDQAPDFAGNIRLDNLDSPQAIKRALVATDQRVGGFDAATRGRITRAETKSLAGELGMTPADLLARRKGQALNAEQALAARQILAKSANELVNLARKVASLDNPGDEATAAFRQAWTRHVAIQEQVAGATAEAGRALAQFRITADSRAVSGDVLKALAEGPQGADRIKQAAELIVENAADPASLNRAAARAMKPRFRDKLVELYYNSILSGPQTHVVNMMSNTMTALSQIPEHAVAAAIGAPRALSRVSRNDRVLFTELGARAVGMLQGTKEGLAQGARTFRTGEASDFVSKVESHEARAISGIKGSIIRTPTRALSAEDEIFKAMARRMELSGLAIRYARAEGLAGTAAKKRATELLANPTDAMLSKAFDYGRYLTFQRPLGPIGQSVSRMTQAAPILKLVLPFVRTPTNILKFSLERSPAAPLLKEWRADVLAGGARRDLAVARVVVGSGAMAATMELVANGHVTGGGPADDNAKGVMRADGWQPYSFKIGDKYYSYQRLDPFATTLGIAADFADLQSHMTDTQRDQVAGLLVASTLKNLSSKTWLSGVADLSEAVSDPERFGASYLRQRAASIAVPALVAQTARTMDPTLREAKTVLDAVRARVPGLSSDLPTKLDVWGRPIENEGGLGPNIVSPVWQSTAKRDPVNAAVLSSGAVVSAPGKLINNRKMTDAEYHQFSTTAGTLAYSRLTSLVGGTGFARLPAESRAELIGDVIKKARKEVRSQMGGSPEASARGTPKARATVPPPPPGFSIAP